MPRTRETGSTAAAKREAAKQQALSQITRLMQQHQISIAEIPGAAARRQGPFNRITVSRVLSTLAGVFLIAGLLILVALQWQEMHSLARIGVSLGSGISIFLAAWYWPRLASLFAPLMVLSATLQVCGMLVLLHELAGSGDSTTAMFISFSLGAAVQGVAYRLRGKVTSAMLGIILASLSLSQGLSLMNLSATHIVLVAGISWLLSAILLQNTRAAAVTPGMFFLGGSATLFCIWEMAHRSFWEPVLPLLACALIALSVWRRSRALNIAATLSILVYTVEVTGEYFADSMGWPLALICISAAMYLISLSAVRIDRRFLR